ncbi:MAG: sulfite exporter TauE/SafE family protein [Rhodospirillaceae bacterium]|nr:sulfite exporter TauE/SafE family protein [Rhodospirillaceae bacterium]MBT5666937.1 sulfite exporter TauE/SafE family protein [Rhodospirillaceae bacterium]MBT5810666.1 sulfite exporter TauE/SafE family protein [Rhodospirillaceae bacterium]
MLGLPIDMLLLLGGATVLAAMLQTATGIGFGLIAGPFVLMALQGRDAIEATALLSLLITLVLAPKLLPDVNRRDLVNLTIGCAVGLPVGLLIYLHADVLVLKLGAAALIVMVLGMTFFPVRPANAGGGTFERSGGVAAGVSAGVFGACLAMPGPVAAVFLVRRGRGKVAIRATMLTFFVFALGASLGLQIIVDGLSTRVLEVSALLAPACAVGLVIGHFAVKRVSEQAFLRLLQIVLAGTVISLLASSYSELVV